MIDNTEMKIIEKNVKKMQRLWRQMWQTSPGASGRDFPEKLRRKRNRKHPKDWHKHNKTEDKTRHRSAA